MSKSRKPGKPKKNRGNVVKKLKLMKSNNEIISRLVEESPILMIYSDDDYDTFENLFGNRWKPILAEWFEDNFGFPVKTIKK